MSSCVAIQPHRLSWPWGFSGVSYERNAPNASHYAARYADRKRAAERVRDAAMGPRACNHCASVSLPGSLFCEVHQRVYAALRAAGATLDEISDFCERTYWPR